jgi:murein L,D-transpeptidase YafK
MLLQGFFSALALSTLTTIHAPPPFAAIAEGPAPLATKGTAAVTEIRIDKGDHTLKLLAGSDVVKSYKVAIGSGGMGPKQYEGDMTTPVGTYRVASRWKGLFHQFLNVSYPNDDDRKRYADLKAKGVVPAGRGVGFGIGIHGVGTKTLNGVHKLTDWTAGCIALDDAEIDELSSLVKDGTKIVITD